MLESYVALDLEMTGLKAGRDKILEIGAVRVKNHRIETEFQCLVNPHRRLEEQVRLLTGITDDMAQEGIEEDRALSEFLKFWEGLPIVGHNIMFDYSFLKQCAVNCGKPFEAEALDTLKLARRLMPELEKKTLDFLCEEFSIIRSRNHRALEDARATARLLELMWERFGNNEPECFVPKRLCYKAKKQGPSTPRQKKYLKELAEYHKIDLSVSIDALTKNEASRLVDRILSQYGKVTAVKAGSDT